MCFCLPGILNLGEQHSGRDRSGCIGLARWHDQRRSDVGGECPRELMDGAHPGCHYHRPRVILTSLGIFLAGFRTNVNMQQR